MIPTDKPQEWKPEEELRALLAQCPEPGSLYQHHKSSAHYVTVAAVIRESDGMPMVVYRRADSDHPRTTPAVLFARPLSEWLEKYQQMRPKPTAAHI